MVLRTLRVRNEDLEKVVVLPFRRLLPFQRSDLGGGVQALLQAVADVILGDEGCEKLWN